MRKRKLKKQKFVGKYRTISVGAPPPLYKLIHELADKYQLPISGLTRQLVEWGLEMLDESEADNEKQK